MSNIRRRVEKKLVNQYRTRWCWECQTHHPLETRLASSRRRRVKAVQRRQTRRLYRQSPVVRWLYKEIQAKLTTEWQAAMYEEFSGNLLFLSDASNSLEDLELGFDFEEFDKNNTLSLKYTEGSDERIQEG